MIEKMPRRRLIEPELLLATHNQGKIEELRTLLKPYGKSLRSTEEFSIEEPEETGTTFEANARLKAEHACQASGLPSPRRR